MAAVDSSPLGVTGVAEIRQKRPAAPDCIGQAAWAGAGGARSGGGVHGNRLQNEAVYIEASNVTGNRGEAESINVYLIAFMNQNIGAVICFAHL